MSIDKSVRAAVIVYWSTNTVVVKIRQPDENNLPVRPIGKKESRRSWRIVRRGLACTTCFSNFDGILSFLRRCECVGLASLLAVAGQ